MGNNVSTLAAGVNAVRKGFESTEVGAASIAAGVVESWATPLRWAYGTGDNETSGMFSLSELYAVVIKPDGKPDGKVLSAKYNALCDGFGIDWGDNRKEQAKLKMMFRRGWIIAAAKFSGVDVQFESRAVSVPLWAAFSLVDTDGKATKLADDIVARLKVNAELEGKTLSDEQAAARMDKMRVVCKGGKHPVFGDVPAVSVLADLLVPHVVAAGLMPPPSPRAGRTDKGASFLSSLDLVADSLASLGGADESLIAVGPEGEVKLRAVAEMIAAYFANK